MTPAALARTMAALGGSRAVAPTTALSAEAVAPTRAAAPPAPDASMTAHAPRSQGLSGSVLHPPMQAPQQAGAVQWESLIAGMGLGRTGLHASDPQPGALSEPDPHGWGAIIADMGLGRTSPPVTHHQTAAQPPVAGTSAEATPWAEVIAEAGLAPGANPPNGSFGHDQSWAMLAAEVAAERPANL